MYSIFVCVCVRERERDIIVKIGWRRSMYARALVMTRLVCLICHQVRYGNMISLLYTDSDSLIIRVQTEDLYADMARMSELYDTSNYPTDHPLHSTGNKKVVGKMKDELGGKVMTEFIGLR